MNARSFAFVMLRLGAILVASLAVQQFPYVVAMVQGFLADRNTLFVLGFSGFLYLAVLACLLWFGANWLSEKVAAPLKKNDPPETPETALLTDETLLRVGLVLIGVYVLFQASVGLVAQLISMAGTRVDLSYMLNILLRTGTFAAFGIICIVSPRSLAAWILRLRRAGSPQ